MVISYFLNAFLNNNNWYNSYIGACMFVIVILLYMFQSYREGKFITNCYSIAQKILQ